jgi:YfiH family protein
VDPGPALVCKALDGLALHLFTTRDWRLGSEQNGDAADAWEEVARALTVAPERLVRVHQVHGADIVVRRAGVADGGDLPPADIIISDDPTAVPAIQTADCVPLLIADRRTGAVAAVHAGWRGLAASVPRVAVDALARAFGSRAADLVAAAGPSIGACCYEVGADVRQRFDEAGFSASQLARWFRTQAQPTSINPSMAGLRLLPRAGHWYLDMWAATRDEIETAGVPPDQIFVAELCTASHPGVLCSYRRDGMGAGRMAGAIRAPDHGSSQRHEGYDAR